MRRALIRGFLALAVALGAGPLAAQGPPTPPAQQPQTPPTFRGGTRLVPVDVRVIDRSGRPVTDLTERDFIVLENGVRQRLSHFSAQALDAEPAAASAARLPRLTDPAPPIGTQTHRIFLIVLGRGRLQPPAKGVDAMIHLVRERLLPQDLVAVMAWNRATDFTTDHEQIAQMLERFKKQHEKIESVLAQIFGEVVGSPGPQGGGGLAAIYGSKEIPASLQGDIDAVMSGPGAAPLRTVVETDLPDARQMDAARRRQIDALQRAEAVANREPGAVPLGAVDEAAALGLDMTLDELASMSAQTMQDVGKITAGIQYLRYLHGEKHLLFVSPAGVFLPRAEHDRNIASLAADARVAIDIVHTGGTPEMRFGRGGGLQPPPPDWRRMTSRTVAEETGGTFTSTSWAKGFVDRLDAATRFQYTLGYYPSNASLDGRFRRIVVRVTRPGLQVLYRHGYFATRELPTLDRRELLTYSRVAHAANLAREIGDITLAATATNGTTPAGAREVAVDLRIRPERLAFVERNGRKHGSIEIAVFCADGREQLIGQSWNVVDLEMTPEAFQRFQAGGLTYTGRVPVSAEAWHVKVIVYDYAADLIGSTMVRIK